MFGSIGKKLSLSNPIGSVTGGIGSKEILDFVPGIGDARAAAQQNAANIKAADKQMAFQERMSSTAYQRAMEDMKKSGLNPMLAFSQGGASTPSGALPTINSETKTKLGEAAISTAMGIKGLGVQQQQANTAQQAAESGIALNSANAAKSAAETQKINLETELRKKDAPMSRLKEKGFSKIEKFINRMIDATSNSAMNKMRSTPDGSKRQQEATRIIKKLNWKKDY